MVGIHGEQLLWSNSDDVKCWRKISRRPENAPRLVAASFQAWRDIRHSEAILPDPVFAAQKKFNQDCIEHVLLQKSNSSKNSRGASVVNRNGTRHNPIPYQNEEAAKLDETSLSPDVGLETLDYAVIILYMISTFGIAVWFGSRQKDTDDFFVGGRRMPWFAVGLSILATLFSTLSYLGGPGEMIKNGIGLLVGNFAHPLSMLGGVFPLDPVLHAVAGDKCL